MSTINSKYKNLSLRDLLGLAIGVCGSEDPDAFAYILFVNNDIHNLISGIAKKLNVEWADICEKIYSNYCNSKQYWQKLYSETRLEKDNDAHKHILHAIGIIFKNKCLDYLNSEEYKKSINYSLIIDSDKEFCNYDPEFNNLDYSDILSESEEQTFPEEFDNNLDGSFTEIENSAIFKKLNLSEKQKKVLELSIIAADNKSRCKEKKLNQTTTNLKELVPPDTLLILKNQNIACYLAEEFPSLGITEATQVAATIQEIKKKYVNAFGKPKNVNIKNFDCERKRNKKR